MLFQKIFSLSLIAGLTLGMVGCSSKDSDSSSEEGVTDVVGKIVDPYIVGATLCEDANRDGECSDGEQTSSASSSEGEFSFSAPLTPGSHIITKIQGTHNGLEYDVALCGVVDEDGNVDIVSPLTTLEAKGLSKAQIASILNDAGMDNLDEDDVSSDPMEGLSGKTSVTDEELKKLQASLATYGLLKVMKGSEALSALSSTELSLSSEIRQIAAQMVATIQSSLNQATFTTIKTQMDSVRDAIPAQYSAHVEIPDITTDIVIKTAVTIMERLSTAGYEKCNESDGNVTLALQEVSVLTSDMETQIQDIAQYYYGLENKEKLASISQYSPSSLPLKVKEGMLNETGVLQLDEQNTFLQVPQVKLSA